MVCISIVNAKGGVAKTTTALCLVSYLASQGHSVLCIDLDPQANASKTLLNVAVGASVESPNLFDALYSYVMEDKKNIVKTAIQNVRENVDLLPAVGRMEAFKDIVKNQARKPLEVLKNILKPVQKQYDFIIIDCPADLSIYVENAIEISDHVICPSTYDIYGMDGLSMVIPIILEFKGSDFENYSVLYTRFNSQATKVQEHIGDLAQELEAMQKVLPMNIPMDQKVINAQALFGDLILDKKFKNSRARLAYQKLGNHIIENWNAS